MVDSGSGMISKGSESGMICMVGSGSDTICNVNDKKQDSAWNERSDPNLARYEWSNKDPAWNE
jgi:hypothetical protein